jgi:predicted metal-dependent phosphoesterase TrpH
LSYDYHTHSTFSDGLLNPDDLIELAVERGIKSISVTDHDSISNYSAVHNACKKNNVELIKGTEISSMYNGRDVHILAYFENETDYFKLETLENKRINERILRLRNICKNLNEIGIMIEPENIIARQEGRGTIGRPQIAREIIEKGYALSQNEVFQKFLVPGTPGYVPSTHDSSLDMIELVRNCNGLPVLAHPGNYYFNNEDDLLAMINAGLLGIECYCPSNNKDKLAYYLNVVKKYNLVATGGSDFHGFYQDRADNFGWILIPPAENEIFRERLSLCANP